MTLRKSPGKSKPTNADIEALIDKGAKVKEDKKTIEQAFINIRIPRTMLDKVNEAVSRRLGIRRTGWILEAMHEKMKSEGSL